MHIGYLGHHGFIDSQSASGIHDHHVMTVLFGVGYSRKGYGYGILVSFVAENFNPYLVPHHVELVDGRRTVNITGNQ